MSNYLNTVVNTELGKMTRKEYLDLAINAKALFFIVLSFYFVVTDFKILNLHNDIIFTYIVIPVMFFIYWLLGKLKLNILFDVCKWF